MFAGVQLRIVEVFSGNCINGLIYGIGLSD